jgi:hypothetical protein
MTLANGIEVVYNNGELKSSQLTKGMRDILQPAESGAVGERFARCRRIKSV